MSLANEKTVDNSFNENIVKDIRKLKLSNTSLGPSPIFDYIGVEGIAHHLREGKDISAYGPPEIVGSLVATSHSLDNDNAESVSLFSNEPVST